MRIKREVFSRISALVLVMALSCGVSMSAMATESVKDLDLNQRGSIFVSLVDEQGELMMDGSLVLYQVASLGTDDGNMVYTYTDSFAGCGAELTQEALDSLDLVMTLAKWIEDQNLTETRVASIANGSASFSDLPLGLYLIMQKEEGRSSGFYLIDPFLVSLPHMEDGVWVYAVDASPKSEVEPAEPEPESEAETSTPVTTTPGGSTPEAGTPGESTPSTLPQTGQLNWPIPILAGGGILLILIGGGLVYSGRRKKNHAA